MKKNLIKGLKFCLEYTGVIAAILVAEIAIDVVAGRGPGSYFSMPYFTVAVSGFVVAFICGYAYPSLLSNSIRSYTDKYPDVPKRYVEEICQGIVTCRYYAVLSCLCLAGSFFYDMDEYPLIVFALTGSGFTFFFQYLRYRQKYKNL